MRSDCNWTRTQNHLVLKRTLNHLAKLTNESYISYVTYVEYLYSADITTYQRLSKSTLRV